MKNKSLKGILALGILMLLQTGCNPQSNDKLALAKQLEQKAAFYRKEGEIDSAIAYYNKSLILYNDIENQEGLTKDTIYVLKIAKINYSIGCCYDSVNDFDNGLKFTLESLEWAKRLPQATLRVVDEYLIGGDYSACALKKENGSVEQMNLYKEGIKHLLASCWAIDSLGWDKPGNLKKNKMALDSYTLVQSLYKKIGDTSREQFYYKKYYDLYVKMYGHAPAN